MCGPAKLWDWLVLDAAWLLVFGAGVTVLRARGAPPAAWVVFGVLSAGTAALLVAATTEAQAALQEAASGAWPGRPPACPAPQP